VKEDLMFKDIVQVIFGRNRSAAKIVLSNTFHLCFPMLQGIAEEPCTAMLPRKANSLANLLMGSKK
jgi:hypothetical protein